MATTNKQWLLSQLHASSGLGETADRVLVLRRALMVIGLSELDGGDGRVIGRLFDLLGGSYPSEFLVAKDILALAEEAINADGRFTWRGEPATGLDAVLNKLAAYQKHRASGSPGVTSNIDDTGIHSRPTPAAP